MAIPIGSAADCLRSWALEREELELLEAILDRGAQLVRQRVEALLRTLLDADGAHLSEPCLHRVKPGGLIGRHLRRGAAELSRQVLVAMRAQPVGEPRGRYEHALGLWVQARRHDFARPVLEHRWDSGWALHRANAPDRAFEVGTHHHQDAGHHEE